MFRPMRRSERQISEAETISILQKCSSGVLAVNGENDYPYAVPLSYAYEEGKIYFHSALEGHKIDAIRKDSRVSFCVIAADNVIPGSFSTNYSSAVLFGRARILEDPVEKQHVLELLLAKYSPEFVEDGKAYIARAWDQVCTVEIMIEHMTGKARVS